MGFSERLRRLREERQLTQAELAERAGLSKAGVTHLEQGLRQPSLATAQAIAKALGVDCTAFNADEGKEETDEPEKRGRGRPRKAEEPASEEPKRPRGRPKKAKE